MPNRYVVSNSASISGSGSVNLIAVTAGSCGLTLRRVDLSFMPTTAASQNYQANFTLARGIASGGSPLTINPVEDANPVAELASATSGGVGGYLLNWLVPDTFLYSASFEGPDGITAVSGNALAVDFISPGGGSWVCSANLWFEE